MEAMLRDLEKDDPPQPAPVEARARRRARRPTLAAALRVVVKAGQHVSGAVLVPDGQIELKFGEVSPARHSSSWDDLETGTRP